MGAEKLPPDLPDDEGLIAEGAAVIGALQAGKDHPSNPDFE